MEKQLYLFKTKEKREDEIWYSLPEESRSKIETSFANLLIRYLCKSIEEASENEN
jgi:hypothetical protein